MDLYSIIITPDAENDLVELRNYIADVLLAGGTARKYINAIQKGDSFALRDACEV